MSLAKDSDGVSPSSSTAKDENANGRDTSHKTISNSTTSNPPGEKKTPTKRCKLVIVGDGCCGKTSLLTVFKRYSALRE